MASTSSAAAGSSSASMSADNKRKDRLQKLKDLQLKRNLARKMNHQEVVEEDRRNKLPSNWEAKKARVEWEEKEEERKKECEAKGEDYEKVKLLDVGANDAEKWERKKKKTNPDQGFSDYEAATFRQYQGLTKQLKVDKEGYEREKKEKGRGLLSN